MKRKIEQNGMAIANCFSFRRFKTFRWSTSSNNRKGGTDVDELTAEVFEIEDKEALIDEMMNKYGQEITF